MGLRLLLQRLLGDQLDTSKLNLKPTFGVSFGLPQGGGSSYPVNPYDSDSLINPYSGYGGGSQGINLGLVSVNPLVAVQVTKDDYGEKVVKPFVNLHVTPNRGLVHKFNDILAHKKQSLFGGHQNYYPPQYYPGGPYYGNPPHHHFQNPHNNHRPSHFERPQYHDHHHYHQPENQYNPHYGPYPGYYNREGSVDDDDDYNYLGATDYDINYRNAPKNITSGNEYSKNFQNNLRSQTEVGRHSNNQKVHFPERRKREVQEVSCQSPEKFTYTG